MNTPSRVTLVALSVSLLCAAAPAAADPSLPEYFDVKSRAVRVDDLTLTDPSGADALLDRIRGAARVVCRRSQGSRGFDVEVDRKRCLKTSYLAAVATIDERFAVDIETIAERQTADRKLEARR